MSNKDKLPARKPNTRRRTKDDAGRPEIDLYNGENPDIFWAKIDNWLMKGVAGTTVAARLGCHPDTFYNFGIKKKRWGKGLQYADFSAYKAAKLALGDDTLRERQYDAAIGVFGHRETISPDGTVVRETILVSKPNVQMMIFLGKNRLQQSESVDVTTNGQDLQPAAPVIIKRIINLRTDKDND